MTRRSRLGAAAAVIIALSLLGACGAGGTTSAPVDTPVSTAPSQAEQPTPAGPQPTEEQGAEETSSINPDHGREVTIRGQEYTCASFWGSQDGCPEILAQPWHDHADNLDRFYQEAEQGVFGPRVRYMVRLENWKSVGYHVIFACRANFTFSEFRLSAPSELSGLDTDEDGLRAVYDAAHAGVCG